MPKNKEPTTVELVQACTGKLDDNTLEAIAEETNFDEALGLAVSALLDAGVDDPFGFLIGKGIVIPQ
jgi:hypothetical protein